MSRETRIVATPHGDFMLRPERPEDDRLLFDLFAFNNIGILQRACLPTEMIEKIINFQYRSQTATYRGLFPDAIFSIVSWGGKDVGRFIEHDETDVVYFVDFVLFPEFQAKGLGAALTRALMDEWAARGRGTRVKIMVTNEPSLKMCRKLGFRQEEESGASAYVEMRWYPPHLAPQRPTPTE